MTCRLVTTALVLCVVGGCQNRPQQLDPFLGKTTVAPPATGAVGGAPLGVNAYPAAPPTMTAQPGAVVPPPGSTIPPPGATTPPGTFQPNTSIPRPLSTTVPPPPTNPLPGSTPTNINVSGPIRVAPPDPNRRTVVSSSAPSGGVDIMDLPVRGTGGPQPKTAAGANGSLQSYTQPPTTFDVNSSAARTITIPGRTEPTR